jgi:hypothetical protein
VDRGLPALAGLTALMLANSSVSGTMARGVPATYLPADAMTHRAGRGCGSGWRRVGLVPGWLMMDYAGMNHEELPAPPPPAC